MPEDDAPKNPDDRFGAAGGLGETLILESIADAFFAVNRSWEVIYINNRAEELLQHSRSELLGTNLWDAFPSEEGAPFRQKYTQAMETNEPVRFESFYPPHERWYKVHAYPFEKGLSVHFSDVTDRKQMEQSLRESEARAQAILETTVDAIITIDAYGHIESFNQAAERIFGYKAEEVIGENVKMLMPDPYRKEHDEYIARYRKTGRRKIIGIGRQVTGKRKDGSTFPMDLAVSEVKLDNRRIFTGIIRDISERRRLEQEVLEVSEQERRRIGQDLHDGLGQMLTGIGLISKNLARKMEDKGIEEASEVHDVADLVKEADEFARTLSRGLVPVDLDAGGLVAALRKLSDQAEQLFRIDCTLELADEVLVHDNNTATNLYRIAQEAVSNAAKHGRASKVTMQLEEKNDQIYLYVADNGIGFDYENKSSDGMGLRIMEYRARVVGGSLDVYSGADEEGTRVVCHIPRKPTGSN